MHEGHYKSAGYMFDQWVCSCGWESGPYFDGAEYAKEAWEKHKASADLKDNMTTPTPGMCSDISIVGDLILVECDHEYLTVESARMMVEDLLSKIKEIEDAKEQSGR